ncbi:MAG: outer rane immunogenic protein [Sphingomonadales bacterium]|nr:outer rane immunogenic protein [Sphingomonadales bacterium]
MRITLIAGLIAAASAAPAFAQDAPPPAPLSGFHVEGLVGYDSTEIADDSEGGILYGARAGYDFQSGRAVFGIEAEANDSTNEGCVTGIAAANDRLCVGAGRELFFGGRAGFIVGRNVLLYGTAGYTNARFDVDYDDGTAGGTSNFVDHADLDGIRVGAGAQFGVGRNAYVRTELRYANYEQGSDRGQALAAFGFHF